MLGLHGIPLILNLMNENSSSLSDQISVFKMKQKSLHQLLHSPACGPGGVHIHIKFILLLGHRALTMLVFCE